MAGILLFRALRASPVLLLFFQVPTKPPPYLKQATISQTAKTLQIAANSPRPLAQALDALQNKYGWLISYEDPQYLSDAEVKTEPAPSGARVRVPAGGAFNVNLPLASANAVPDEAQTLQALVDAYNQTGNPGHFELRKGPEQDFDVVGISAHDAKGNVSKQTVVLDTAVTLPAQSRTVLDTIDAILQQVSQADHVAIELAISPRSLLRGTNVTLGGTNEPARTLLRKTLAATNRTFWWRLLFDPETRAYVLSLHVKQAH
jgi:hypothetical protein